MQQAFARADETKNLLNDTESVRDTKDVYDILYLPGARALLSFQIVDDDILKQEV